MSNSKQKRILLVFVVLVFVIFSLGGKAANAYRWDPDNDPSIFDPNFKYQLAELPPTGQLKNKPWAETYWPANKGSINIRWNQEEPDGFGYYSPSREELLQMPRSELAKLAPSEKYDIYMGHYDYPTKSDAERFADPRALDWNGICDGWSIAAVQYLEPEPVDAVNPDGIVVPFGSSDIKGLMSFVAAAHFEVKTAQVGVRCKHRLSLSDPCSDVNAGALHVILANQVSLKQQPFVVQIDPKKEIWNQPILGYEFEYLGSVKSKYAAEGVQVHSTLLYTDELDRSQWAPSTGMANFPIGKMEMDYTLDLDEDGNIIGGSYDWGSRHPDFVWLPLNHLEFTEDFAGINKLYKPVKNRL